jgi:integrase/recombinase XerD
VGYIDDYCKYQTLRGFSPRTIERRRWSLQHLTAFVAPIPVEQATGPLLEEFLLRWASPQSRYSVRSDVHQFFRWAIRRDLAAVDPTDKIEPPRLAVRAATQLRPDDLHRALLAADGDLRLMIALGAYAGLRISEIAALRGRDIGGGRLVVRGGKGGKDRIVPLAPVLRRLLADAPSGPLFPDIDGQGVGARIRRHFRRLGIEARPHDLRHSFVTEAAQRAGGNLVLVAQLAGHSSVVTTQRYMKWTPEGADVVAHLFEPLPPAA